MDETLEKNDFQQIRRTSRHTPVRRRENSNRSNREVFLLVFRATLLVILLAGSFFALKIGLGALEKPSEKEMQKWAEREALMETAPAVVDGLAEALAGETETLALTPDLLEQRLQRWTQTEQDYRTAEALYRRGLNEEAVVKLKQLLRAAPENSEAQHLLLEICMATGAYDAALPLSLSLLEKNPKQWDVRRDLLTALVYTGRAEATLLLAESMLEEKPNDMEVLEIAAVTYAAENRSDQAKELFDRILRNDRRHVVALEGFGRLHRKAGEYDKAVPYYTELVRIAPQPEYYHALAVCYAQQGEPGKAVILMGQAASLYGEAAISSWFADAEFDPVRTSVEFRSFTDQVVGIEMRRQIESLRHREVQKEQIDFPGIESSDTDQNALKPSELTH